MPGRFITLEGGEGTGKSTQVQLLVEALGEKGIEAIATREPGGSEGAERIREILVTGAVGRWDGMTEALLFFAARRDHLRKTVWPALAQGTWVVCDRFADSTRAYQAAGQGIADEAVESLYALAVGDFKPDLTVVLDLPPEIGLARARGRGDGEDRFEGMDLSFHQRLRDAFLRIAAAEPARCAVLDADTDIAGLSAVLRATVSHRLGQPL
ncbi:MAG: dTMP kinase [Magnetospiraceae bacterium]